MQENLISQATYPEMLTIEQTAARSGLSAYAVRKMARGKTGAAFPVRVGQKYLLNQTKFIAFLNCAPQEDTPDPAGGIQPVPEKIRKRGERR